MAFDFPNGPAVDDEYSPSLYVTYVWNGEAWIRKGGTGGAGGGNDAASVPVNPPVNGETEVQSALMSLDAEISSLASDTTGKVERAGDTMMGVLTLFADPTAPLHSVTKQYVDRLSGVPAGGVTGQALVIDAAGAPVWGAPIQSDPYVLAADAGQLKLPSDYQQNELPRWSMNFGDSDEDADFRIQRFNDGGGLMGDAIHISRQTGDIDLDRLPTIKGKPVLSDLEKRIIALERKLL